VNLFSGRIVEQRVDGEVAAGGILFLGAEHVVAQDAPVFVRHLFIRVVALPGAEGGYLHRVIAEHDVHQPEAPADDARAPERAAYLLGRGTGGDVEILGLEPEQQVAHRAADDVGGEAFLLQGTDDPTCAGTDTVAGNAVFVARDDLRLCGV
jgi:hypothetical protein